MKTSERNKPPSFSGEMTDCERRIAPLQRRRLEKIALGLRFRERNQSVMCVYDSLLREGGRGWREGGEGEGEREEGKGGRWKEGGGGRRGIEVEKEREGGRGREGERGRTGSREKTEKEHTIYVSVK